MLHSSTPWFQCRKAPPVSTLQCSWAAHSRRLNCKGSSLCRREVHPGPHRSKHLDWAEAKRWIGFTLLQMHGYSIPWTNLSYHGITEMKCDLPALQSFSELWLMGGSGQWRFWMAAYQSEWEDWRVRWCTAKINSPIEHNLTFCVFHENVVRYRIL